MKAWKTVLLGVTLLLAGALPALWASGQHSRPLPPCEPGYQWVEEVCYKDVEHYVCKVVPEVKKVKKIVYTTKNDPFCLPGGSHATGLLGGHGGCRDGSCATPGCPTCEGPFNRKILVKKEIICEEHTTKCVTEKVVQKVPYTVLRKVPCALPLPATTPAPPVK